MTRRDKYQRAADDFLALIAEGKPAEAIAVWSAQDNPWAFTRAVGIAGAAALEMLLKNDKRTVREFLEERSG